MIPKIRRILHATDLSANAVYSFQYAVDTAEKYDAEIIILHVIEEDPAAVRVYNIQERDVAALKEKALKELNRYIGEVFQNEFQGRADCIKGIDVKEGYPAEEILKTVDEQNCDMIVMGDHGKGFLTHAFLGSVAERVLRSLRKPVLIIPLPKQ